MNIRPYQPPDKGYYFKMNHTEVKIVRYTLEDNGFRETKKNDWALCWSSASVKLSLYANMTKF